METIRYSDVAGTLLPSIDRTVGREEWTDLAFKYGHPVDNTGIHFSQEILRGTGKSGLTPIPSPIDVDSQDERMRLLRRKIERYQQQKLKGFTAAELIKMEVSTANIDTVTLIDLNNPIHELFIKERWYTEADIPKDMGMIPILGDHDGLWEVDNPIVWELLEPCLRLASVFLENQSSYPWLDALLFGQRREVDPAKNPHPDICDLETFHQRPVKQRTEQREADNLREVLKDMAKHLKLRLTSGWCEEDNSLPREDFYFAGATTTPRLYNGKWQLRIFMSIEFLQPLLRNDLTPAERLHLQFTFAHCLLHEIAHTAEHYQLLIKDGGTFHTSNFDAPIEPYFENERHSELGWSFVSNMLGGHPRTFIEYRWFTNGPGLPQYGLWRGDPVQFELQVDTPVLLPKRCLRYYDAHPVPVSYIDRMFQQTNWELYVKKFGAKATAMGPLTFGTRTQNEPMERIKYKPLNFGSTDYLINSFLEDFGVTSDDMPVTVRQDIMDDNARVAHARRIIDSMKGSAFYDLEIPLDFLLPDHSSSPVGAEDIIQDTYTCPRWDEITNYLFKNRGPCQLALDTMAWASEPTFYRYIRDRGGLEITPREFRNFLGVANERRELFLWRPFPGAGTVKRIERGWPDPAPVHLFPAPSGRTSQRAKEHLVGVLGGVFMQRLLYHCHGESRDVDIAVLTSLINEYNFGDEEPHFKFSGPGELEDAAAWVLRRGLAKHFTFGPKGIIRLTYDIRQYRFEHASEFTKDRIDDFNFHDPDAKMEPLGDPWSRMQ